MNNIHQMLEYQHFSEQWNKIVMRNRSRFSGSIQKCILFVHKIVVLVCKHS